VFSSAFREDKKSPNEPDPKPQAAVENPTQVIYEEQQPVLVLRAAVLRVVAGIDRGATCCMNLSRVTVGSAPDNSLVLTDPAVSRHHLEFQVHDQGFLVHDLDSTNGTRFRGARVQEVMLGLGAEIRLGSTVLRIERGEETSQRVEGKQAFGGLIGTAPSMQELYGLLSAVAPTDVTVLIEGETGTGKELVAQEVHRQSPRGQFPYAVVDCGAMPANLIESELFGHERGAFTGAVTSRDGVMEKARGGVVFFDEIGELPLPLQTRLLRMLDQRMVKRVGSNLERKVDVRIIAATNRNLEREVQAGRFRQDLFYRLAAVRIFVPPLRKRTEDIPILARHFLWQAGCADPDRVLNPELLRFLCTRKWPGNVRELRNVVERAVVLTDGSTPTITPSMLPEPSEPRASEASQPRPSIRGPWLADVLPDDYLDQPFPDGKEDLVSQFEELYLERLVSRHGRNISRIARDAGVDRKLVRRLLRKHGLGDDEEI
jgi:DNA-binding NtrC family response regulator